MFGLQSVGLTGDEHPLTSITAMADRNIEAIRTVQPRGPYHLGGRCWGAVVALEMAHRLIAGGDEVGLLCFMNVSPSDFPGLVSTSSRRRFRRRGRDTEMGALWRGTVAPAWWKRPLYLAREVARGARRELMHLGKKGLVRTLFGLDLPLPQWLRDADFLNLEAFARHTSRAYPGRVLLILSAEDLALCGSDPAPVWRELAGEGVEIRSVPGRDDAMFREPEVQLLAELLRTSLRAARA